MKAPATAREYLATVRRRFGTDSASAIEWMETDRAQQLYIARNSRMLMETMRAEATARMIAVAIAHLRAQAAKPARKPNTNARVHTVWFLPVMTGAAIPAARKPWRGAVAALLAEAGRYRRTVAASPSYRAELNDAARAATEHARQIRINA